MIYRVLLVDDEMPSLRYIQSIVEKYAPSFRVASACTGSEKALEYLRDHPVDLLITDINMHGTNGIELSRQARALYPDIHIVIISGYAEFEYAQGAIQAAVEEYILKPVSVSQMRGVLARLKEQLDGEFSAKIHKLLPVLACGSPADPEAVRILFGASNYRFALIRFGNLNLRLPETLNATAVAPCPDTECFALCGRDEDEQILIFNEQDLEPFLTDISVYMSQHSSVSTWTVVYQSATQPIGALSGFIRQALPMLQRQVSIGRHQILPLNASGKVDETPHISCSKLRQLSYFASSGKPASLKEYFLSLAGDWERVKLKQVQAWTMVRQMARSLAGDMPSLDARLDDVLSEIQDLFLYASSYGDLLLNIYTVLFDDNTSKDRKMSTRELYDYAIRYIDENYAKPLSMQSVCEDIGISRTYLSRLFRRYSDSTFNAYLTRRRIEAAMQLLSDRPNILLRDVAACVGYEDSSYFSKVFHQYSGQTPSQYATRR